MHSKLPSRPNLEHLKSQAKDLLAAVRSGKGSDGKGHDRKSDDGKSNAEALARVRAAVPAYANQSDDAIRNGPFALHDAQSAIAREYGFPSWVALRDHVSQLANETASGAPSEASKEASADALVLLQAASGRALPAEVQSEVRRALERRGVAVAHPTPPAVPVLPLRNAVAFPGAIVPIDVARPGTLRAIDTAVASEPAFLAVFSQRSSDVESPTLEDLHPTGCLCNVLFVHRPEQGAWVLLEGVRWVSLEALVQTHPYYLAHVADSHTRASDAHAIDELDRKLRDRARRLAATLPDIRDAALAMIEATSDTAQLADLVMANLAGTVDDKAAYARQSDLVRKLEHVVAQLDAELAKSAPPE